MPKFSKGQLVILLVIIAVAFGLGVLYGVHRQNRAMEAAALLTAITEEPAPLIPAAEPAATAPEPEPSLTVHVKGAVENPGIYDLPPGSRVADALDLAVLLPDANTDIINLAAKLDDGEEVVVPFRVEGEETDWQALAQKATDTPAAATASTAAAPAIVHINSADMQALQSLSGIGPAKAQAIINYREQHGPFQKIEDIKKVSGIGPATYDNIKGHITVE